METELETEPEPELELESGRGKGEGCGGTEGRGPAFPSTSEILRRQRTLGLQVEEYRQRNGDFPDSF